MTWIKASDVPTPAVGNYSILAEFMLDYDVYSMIQGGALSFKRFPTVSDFIAEIVQYAFSLTQNVYQQKLAPPNWNWAMAGLTTAEKALNYLSQIPMNIGDPNTVSILTAWQNGKLDFYGGHDPIAASVGDGVNTTTGPKAVKVTSIFGIVQ